MAKFRKVIVRPGVFKVNTPNGKEVRAITEKYLRDVAKTAKEMLSVGMRIPSPFAHKDESGIVPSVLLDQDSIEVDAQSLKKKNWSSDINAGFWEDFEVNQKGELVGVLDIPGEEGDKVPSKIRNTIKETSVFVEPEFTDGLGRTWKNALRHVALVTNPVEPNQENFQLIPSDKEFSLAMSFSMADEVSQPLNSNSDTKDSDESDKSVEPTSNEDSSTESNVSELVTLVKDKLGFDMPSDTNERNFLDRLRTILVSIPEDENPDEEMKDLTQKPKGSETQASTVIMANETKTPETTANPDNLVLMEKKLNKLVSSHLSVLKEQFTKRINELIAKGKIGRKYADATLLPAAGSLAMSLDDMDEEGNFPKTPLEMALELLEENESLVDSSNQDKLDGEVIERNDDTVVMSKDEQENLYESILS